MKNNDKIFLMHLLHEQRNQGNEMRRDDPKAEGDSHLHRCKNYHQ